MAATPIRSVKIGALWTTAQEFAALHGVTMTAFVEVALEQLLADPLAKELLDEKRRDSKRDDGEPGWP
jgi:hypothetical protein